MEMNLRTSLLLILAILTTEATHAEFAVPFAVQNQNPFVSMHGLPRYASANVLGSGESQIDLSYAVASNFESGSTPLEQIRLDGESERWGLRYLRGVGNGWEVGVDVPFVKHSGGYLDGVIINWHDWFGLPQGGRDQTAQRQFEYAYVGADGRVAFGEGSGLGDMQWLIGKTLHAADDAATVVRGHFKLPTGDEDQLLGSRGVDLGVTLHHVRQLQAKWSVGLSVGATYLSEGDVLPQQTRPFVGHAGGFTSYAATERLRLTVQWDVHSQVFDDTRLRQLNEIAYVLSFGADMKFGRSNVRFAVVENYPHPKITPDVAFFLEGQWRT
jgi:hypothetical protein